MYLDSRQFSGIRKLLTPAVEVIAAGGFVALEIQMED
jgi:hypothetical protein